MQTAEGYSGLEQFFAPVMGLPPFPAPSIEPQSPVLSLSIVCDSSFWGAVVEGCGMVWYIASLEG